MKRPGRGFSGAAGRRRLYRASIRIRRVIEPESRDRDPLEGPLVPMARRVSRAVFADTAECGSAQGDEEAPAILVNTVASFRH
jgi:hypothetical protein